MVDWIVTVVSQESDLDRLPGTRPDSSKVIAFWYSLVLLLVDVLAVVSSTIATTVRQLSSGSPDIIAWAEEMTSPLSWMPKLVSINSLV